MAEKIHTALRLEERTIRQVDELAKALRGSRSQALRLLVEEALEERAGQRRKR